jgi:type I thyroxine 5'-deiodinase
VVYIREAHALDSSMPMGGGGMPIVEDPVNLKERRQVAAVCMAKLELEDLPALIDELDDRVNRAYQGWPDRLYLVGRDGRLAYCGGEGPMGFSPAELEDALRAELGLAPLQGDEPAPRP